MSSYLQVSELNEINGRSDSQVPAKKLTCRWSLPLMSVTAANYCCRFSPQFHSKQNLEPSWRLSLKSRHPGSKYFAMFLYMNATPISQIRGKFKFSVLNANDEEIQTKSKPIMNFVPCLPAGFEKFAKKGLVFGLATDKLTFLCEISYTVNQYESPVSKHIQQYNHVLKELQRDLISLLNNGKFSDVTFSVSGVKFRAHKAILAARSQVFAAMFEHEMTESKTNYVEIMDISPESFKEMLNFIYQGTIRNLEEFAWELLAASDKYALNKLKRICEERLCDNLSLVTAVPALIVADLHSCQDLKVQAINFIICHAADVMKTTDWEYLQKFFPHLVSEASQAIAAQCSKKFNNSL